MKPGNPVSSIDYSEGQRLAVAYAEHPDQATRDAVVAAYLPVARFVARQMARERDISEELTQIAVVGLLEALTRYDPAVRTQFRTYAEVTMRGTIRHHLRGRWQLHVPRRTQELSMLLPLATEACTALLHRTPTTGEVAERAGVTTIAVIDARDAGLNFWALPLDPEKAQIGSADDLEAVDRRVDLAAMLADLTPRRRAILALRYGAGHTQAEIGEILGLSQMTVSREILVALARCRSYGSTLALD